MSAVRMLVVAVLCCLGLVGVTASPAAACSCAAEDQRTQLSITDVVFVGTLTDSSQDGDDMNGVVTYTFDVDEVYKGRTISPVQVTTGVQSTACGLPDLAVDEEYVVFAGVEDGDVLGTSSCSGTTSAAPGLVRRVAELAGAPSKPSPAPSGGVPVLGIAGGVAGVLVAGGLFLTMRGTRGPH